MLFIDYGVDYVNWILNHDKKFMLFNKIGAPLLQVNKLKTNPESQATFTKKLEIEDARIKTIKNLQTGIGLVHTFGKLNNKPKDFTHKCFADAIRKCVEKASSQLPELPLDLIGQMTL